MRLARGDVVLFKALYLVAAGIVVSQVLGQGTLTSILFLLTFPLTVLLWLCSVRYAVTGMDLLMLGTAILATVNVFLNASVARAHVDFSYLKKLIMFIMSLMFLQTAHRMRITQEIVRFVSNTVDVLAVFLIFMFFWRNRQMHLLKGVVTSYLTFRFSNPNLTGLFITSIYMLEMRSLIMPDRLFPKLFHVVIECFLAFFVVQTQARNCLLVLALFTAASIWLVFRGQRNMRIHYGLAVAIAVFPAAFAVAYMLLVSNQQIQHIFSFLVGEGKDLDSRVFIWKFAFTNSMSSPVIGAYCQSSYGTGQFQMHNTHLDIAASYGFPILILVCTMITVWLHRKGQVDCGRDSSIYILGFACAVLMGIGEAALFSGGLGIYVFIGGLLLLSNRET